MPLSNLSAISSGNRSVSIRLLSRIADLLNCSVSDFFEEQGASPVFKDPCLSREIARIEELNPMGRDKTWVHRVMLARRNHAARLKRPGASHGKK